MRKKRKKYLGDYTVTEVAMAVGVSASTVSRILSDKIAPESEAAHKVRKFMQSKGLRLDRPGNSSRGDIYLVCDIAGDESVVPNSAFPYIYKALISEAEKRGYNLLHSQRNAINSILNSPKGAQAVGIIFHSHPFPIARKLPVLAIDHGVSPDEISIVQADMIAGYINAFKRLKDLGHERIAFFFDHDKERSFFPDYVRFMRFIYETAGFEWDEKLFWGEQFESGRHQPVIARALSHFMSLKRPPSAIALHADFYAIGFYSEINLRGMRIPDDISLVGSQDSPLCKLLPVPLSSLRTCPDSIARSALSIIEERIVNPSAPPRKVSICPELVVRESVRRI